MRSIFNKIVSDLQAQVESATIDIKAQLDKECSLKYLESVIKMRKELWRKETLLWRVAEEELSAGWRKGRLFDVHLGCSLMTPTNMKSVSWLDLAEFTLNCVEVFKEYPYLNERFVQHTAEDYQLKSHYWRWSEDYSSTFEHLTKKYFEHVDKCLGVEQMYNAAESLSRKRDTQRFEDYIRYTLPLTVEEDHEFHLTVFPRLLIEHCSDSAVVVKYFLTLSSFGIDNIVKYMHPSHLYFFMLHIFNLLDIHPQQCEFEEFILNDLQLVERAFSMGRIETLELLLEFGWPCKCDRFADEERLTALKWPRIAEDIRGSTSSNTAVFTASFVLYLLDTARNSDAPRKVLTDCIRLFWRTVPTPFISEVDLEGLFNTFHRMKYTEHSQYREDADELFRFMSPILKVYPSDCFVTYQPRSLLHLSRCKIRETINLTCNVYKLPLPTFLQEYVRLKR